MLRVGCVVHEVYLFIALWLRMCVMASDHLRLVLGLARRSHRVSDPACVRKQNTDVRSGPDSVGNCLAISCVLVLR